MIFEQIKQLYPDAFLADEQQHSDQYFVYPYNHQWIHLKKQSVSSTELELLNLLFQQKSEQTHTGNGSHSQWQKFLLEETHTPPAEEKLIRIIQIDLKKKDEEFDEELWLESIANLFYPTIDLFFVTNQLCLVIQNEEGRYLKSEEMAGILQTLDDDFSAQTVCYVGQYWVPDKDLLDIYKEERRIFRKEKKRSSQTIMSLSDVALRYFTEDAVSESVIMGELKNYIASQSEWEELILALWQSRGNVSMAAKSMYVHRNTLQYRIDKFNESTGLSLRDMNDLIICYMLIV